MKFEWDDTKAANNIKKHGVTFNEAAAVFDDTGREKIIKKSDELKPEYDLRRLGQGVRGKYYDAYQKGTNIVVIDPDLTETFPNTQAVNDALRKLLQTVCLNRL